MSTYYEENKERLIKQQRARDALRKDEIAKYQKAYREANKEKRKLYHAAYYQANKEDMKAKAKAYYQANKEYYAALNRAMYLRHREELLEVSRAYYGANRKALLQAKKEYYRACKADFIRRNATRRARARKATPDWADLGKMSKIYAECAALTKTTGIMHHVHHIVPLADIEEVCGLHCESNLKIVSHVEHVKLHSSDEVLKSLWI